MKKSFVYAGLAIAALSLVLSSCATIISGTKEKISINSSPQGTVKVTGNDGKVYFNGSTPANPKLPRSHTYTLVFKVNGYKSKTIQLTHGLNGWFFGNLLFGGIPGGAVDAIDGAMWKLEPSSINVQLQTAMLNGQKHLAFVVRGIDANGKAEKLILPMEPIG